MIEIGDYICDMHNGLSPQRLREIANLLEVEEVKALCHVKMPMIGGGSFIEKSIRAHDPRFTYTNKCLAVIHADERGELSCAYSYDDRCFGVVCLKLEKRS